MKIGRVEVSRDQALSMATDYARAYPGTILYYDLGGDPDGKPGAGSASEPVDRITLADLARLVVFNARLRAEDVPTLLSREVSDVLDPIVLPVDARLEDCTPGSDLEQAAGRAYDRFRFDAGSGIQRAKRSKLLHIKRPWLVPIHDSRIDVVYRALAVELGHSYGRPTMYWEAIRRDLVAGTEDLAWLAATLGGSEDALHRQMSRLSPLRMLDVLAWSLTRAVRG